MTLTKFKFIAVMKASKVSSSISVRRAPVSTMPLGLSCGALEKHAFDMQNVAGSSLFEKIFEPILQFLVPERRA